MIMLSLTLTRTHTHWLMVISVSLKFLLHHNFQETRPVVEEEHCILVLDLTDRSVQQILHRMCAEYEVVSDENAVYVTLKLIEWINNSLSVVVVGNFYTRQLSGCLLEKKK